LAQKQVLYFNKKQSANGLEENTANSTPVGGISRALMPAEREQYETLSLHRESSSATSGRRAVWSLGE